MSIITVGEELAAALAHATETVELRSPSGRRLGQFTPQSDDEIDRSKWPPPLTGKDRDQIMQGPWYTTEEVLAHLKSLE